MTSISKPVYILVLEPDEYWRHRIGRVLGAYNNHTVIMVHRRGKAEFCLKTGVFSLLVTRHTLTGPETGLRFLERMWEEAWDIPSILHDWRISTWERKRLLRCDQAAFVPKIHRDDNQLIVTAHKMIYGTDLLLTTD